MQGKGIVKFFLVVMAIVCAIQYLLILPTRKVEKNADAYAEKVAMSLGDSDLSSPEARQARIEYLDSMSSEEVFRIPLIKSYTYEELKRQQLALGLDLKGGMSVVLQVDLKDFLLTLSNDSRDPTFLEAIANTDKAMTTAQTDYVTLFGEEFEKLSDEKKLSSIFSRSATLRDQINFETSNAEVISVLRTSANETVDLTYKRLKDRIDKLGVVQPNVSLDAARDLILVELPGIDNPERARSFLASAAKLEFWDVYRVSDQGMLNAFVEADSRLKRIQSGDTTNLDSSAIAEVRMDTIWEAELDTLGNPTGDSTFTVTEVPVQNDPFSDRGPLLSIFDLNAVTSQGQTGFPLAVMGVADENKMNQITEYLEKPEIKRLFPQDVFFRWSQKPYKDFQTGESSGRYELYAIRKRRGSEKAPLTGDHVIRATSQPDPVTQEVAVSLSLDNQGARIWGDMTTKAAQDNNREIAIMLDDEVVSAPRVNEPITNGDSRISGDFTIQEGQDLANILQIGKLPATPRIISEAVVGPSLGQDNINRSLTSLIIGFSLVIVFMLFYYGGAGIVSIIALLANLFFIFGALASYGTVLTLPGFAGIILTIGMAVDANVIIYERIREELREGKSMLMSISDGFKHSYSAIIDANVTTILVALVLSYFGIGPIKGFAVVLIIGVIFSMFTAVLLSRLVIDWWTSKGKNISFWSGPSANLFSNLTIDWLGKRKMAYFISGAIILAGLVSFVTRGFDLGVDFKGGHAYTIQFDPATTISANDLRVALTDVFESQPVVKSVDTENTYNVVTDYMIDSDAEDADVQVMQKLHEGVNAMVGGNLDLDQFKDSEADGTHVISSSKVGPTIAEDIKESSVYAGVFALLCIFLYIFIRFSKWQYSAGAVAALFHDSLIVLSVFSLLHGIVPWTMEIDQNFIAALLTVIGYSINDTVIIFDRIREFLNQYTKRSKAETINMAINSTFSRTIITSLTTLLVVLILFLFGGASIKGFAFALVIGIISGTYSTVFIATPMVHDLTGEMTAKQVGTKKHFSKAVKSKV
ncbi:MAG: protein translocase subunit SecDF [Saprospiraceae bacterium]|nr:protein translocase subunit SecDF [Saprospiraceae bacterium]